MALGDLILGDAVLLETRAGQQTFEGPDRTHWITIQETLVSSVKIGSLSCELVMNGKSSCSFILVNPAPVPQCGQTVKFIDNSKLRFGGFIQTVTLNTDQSEAAKEYTIDCVGWEGQLDRHLVKSSYTEQPVEQLISFVITDAGLVSDGFAKGYTDPGPPVLSLIDADYVRASDYLRDIATAGGGAIEINPEKLIEFRTVQLREAPFPLINAEPEYVSTVEDLDEYVNSMRVFVTGTDGATANVVRDDSAQIALRQTVEGGSGRYEGFERIRHPTSNDVVELARLGISVAFLFMQSRARLNKKFTTRLRRNLLEVGQLITVDMPGMNLSGDYQINRMSMTDEEDKLLYEIEATYTSKRQLNLDSLLKIVQAAKTTIVIPTEEFQNEVTFTTLGSQNWNVPGTGTVQVEVEVLGAGGGGGGGPQGGDTVYGGRGGNGGKATSFEEYAAGTTLTIVVGTGGTGGATTTNGNAGTSSYVSSPTESRVAEGFGGAGGYSAVFFPNFFNSGWTGNQAPSGNDGSATGDYPFVGGGMPGGQGVNNALTGAAGTNGKVIIRY